MPSQSRKVPALAWYVAITRGFLSGVFELLVPWLPDLEFKDRSGDIPEIFDKDLGFLVGKMRETGELTKFIRCQVVFDYFHLCIGFRAHSPGNPGILQFSKLLHSVAWPGSRNVASDIGERFP